MKYIELNPRNDEAILPDCMIRAVTLATELPYDNVYQAFCGIGFCMIPDDRPCKPYVSTVLSILGFNYEYIESNDSTKSTVGEWADSLEDALYIFRVKGHVACVAYGVLFDTWNCSNKIVIGYYKIKD